jgi:hypothetical protein
MHRVRVGVVCDKGSLESGRDSQIEPTSVEDAIENALPGIGPKGALDNVTANTLAATLWQVAHPPRRWRAYTKDHTIAAASPSRKLPGPSTSSPR